MQAQTVILTVSVLSYSVVVQRVSQADSGSGLRLFSWRSLAALSRITANVSKVTKQSHCQSAESHPDCCFAVCWLTGAAAMLHHLPGQPVRQ